MYNSLLQQKCGIKLHVTTEIASPNIACGQHTVHLTEIDQVIDWSFSLTREYYMQWFCGDNVMVTHRQGVTFNALIRTPF